MGIFGARSRFTRVACFVATVVVVALVGVEGSSAAKWAIASAGVTERVSVSSSGDQANSDSQPSAISAEGRFVAFASYASNLVPGDTNGWGDVFVHDRQTGVTDRVDVD